MISGKIRIIGMLKLAWQSRGHGFEPRYLHQNTDRAGSVLLLALLVYVIILR